MQTRSSNDLAEEKIQSSKLKLSREALAAVSEKGVVRNLKIRVGTAESDSAGGVRLASQSMDLRAPIPGAICAAGDGGHGTVRENFEREHGSELAAVLQQVLDTAEAVAASNQTYDEKPLQGKKLKEAAQD